MVWPEKPSTASTSWLWKDSRRISPSVTTGRPARSWSEIAQSTALSSMRLNSAAERSPDASRPRASSNSGGLRRLPTTSARKVPVITVASLAPGRAGGLADALDFFAVRGDQVDEVGDHFVVAGAAGDNVRLGGKAGRTRPEARHGYDVVATLAGELVHARVVEDKVVAGSPKDLRSEEHTSELQ